MKSNRTLFVLLSLLTLLSLYLPNPVLAAPASPSGLTAALSAGPQVALAWTDNSTDETGFRIERSPDGIAPFVTVQTVAANQTAFNDNTVTAGNTFTYRVIAAGAPDSAPSNTVAITVAVPLAPSSLSAVVAGRQINLTWTDNSNNESGFTVQRSLDNFATAPSAAFPVAANLTHFSDPGLLAPNTFSYRVLAVNALGNSVAPSNTVSTLFSPPAAPSALFATLVGAAQASLAWTDNSSTETGFRLERSSDGLNFSALAPLAAANAVTFNDATLTSGAFFYRVVAVSASGDSTPSNLTSVRAVAPTSPSSLVVAFVKNRFDLSWSDNSDNETSFRLERSSDAFATPSSATFALAAGTSTFSDTTLVVPGHYFYRVFAVNPVGDSLPSAVVDAVLPAPARLTEGPIDPASIYQADPVTGFPAYYQDDQGTRISLLPLTGNLLTPPTQIFQLPNPANPYSVFLSFDQEAFYYDLTGKFDTRFGKGLALMGLEAGFATLTTTEPQQEAVFARLRFDITGLTVPGVYTIQHPYGTETVTVTADDVARHKGLKFTTDVPVPTARDFYTATTGKITRFLRQTVPPPPAGWIGDGVSIGPVSGSPTGFNAVQITGPAGVNLDGQGHDFILVDQFTVAGRQVTAALPSPAFTTALSPSTAVAPVTAAFTDTSTGTPTGWLWNFGDGTFSTLQNPVKIYSTDGNFTVTLTVSNANGAATTSRTLSIYRPLGAAFTRSAVNGLPPVPVNFADTSAGTPSSWVWDFGDGSPLSASPNPSHSFAAGSWTVNLTVTNPSGVAASSQTLAIAPNLTVAFTKDIASGVAPLTVRFTDTSVGNVAGRTWDFGDGSPTSLQQNPSHVFAGGGAFKVTLTVTNAQGTAATSQTISVFSTLTSGFSLSAATGAPPLAVNFTDRSSGLPASWLWTFGDGTSSTLQNPSKTFTLPGSYAVTLAVTNPIGTNSSSQTVTVSNLFIFQPPLVQSLKVGPIDPAFIYQNDPNTSYPTYYQDDQGTLLALLPVTGDGLNAPTQIYLKANPANPYSAFLGFDQEAFYYDLTGKFDTRFGKGLALMGLEAGFTTLTITQPNAEAVFARLRFNITGITVPGIYTIQHPYGTETTEVTPADIARHRGLHFTKDVGLVQRDFLFPTTGKITRFLRQTVPPPPPGWIGDGVSIGPVTGSPTGFNAVRITGPAGVNLDGAGHDFIIIDQFTVAGRLAPSLAPAFTTSLSPASGLAPCDVTFTDATTAGIPATWLWDFGDGATSRLQNPVHTYAASGNYTVKLTVADSRATVWTTQIVSIFSSPVAAFTSAVDPALSLSLNFTDASQGNVTGWIWDFGDGSVSVAQNPSKTFAAAGTYPVSLTVTNPAGSASVSHNVIVLAPPLPAAPSALHAASLAFNQITLAWTDNSTNETGFLVERSTAANSGFVVLATLAANVTSFTDSAVVSGTRYFYEVFAVGANGNVLNLGGPLSLTVPAPPISGGGGGGGGGFAPPSPPPSPAAPQPVALTGLTGSSPPVLDSAGLVAKTVSLVTAVGDAALTLPSGTRMLNSAGAPVASLTAARMVSPPSSPPRGSIIVGYTFGPTGAQFNPPITITLNFTAAQVPPGVPLASLVVAYWDGQSWVILPTLVDPLILSASAQVSHFTEFALIQDPGYVEPPPGPSPSPSAVPASPSPSPQPSPVITPSPSPAQVQTTVVVPTPSPALPSPATEITAPAFPPAALPTQPAPPPLPARSDDSFVWLLMGMGIGLAAAILAVLAYRRGRSSSKHK